jgi:hypothetical protein
LAGYNGAITPTTGLHPFAQDFYVMNEEDLTGQDDIIIGKLIIRMNSLSTAAKASLLGNELDLDK